jgi:PAS domain-containing protein
MVSDNVFNTAFYCSPIGEYLLAPTDKLEILTVNDAFLRSVGRQREEVLGVPLFEAFGNNPDDSSELAPSNVRSNSQRACPLFVDDNDTTCPRLS